MIAATMESPADAAPLKVYYRDAHVTIYHDDTGRVLNTLPDGSIGAVVTDPTYPNFTYVQEWESRSIPFDPLIDARWIYSILAWYGGWIPQCARVTGDGPMWLFLHPHYQPFVQRILTFLRWAPVHVRQLPPREVLISLGYVEPIPIDATENRYGAGKPIALLRSILRATPRLHRPLLEPFMGGGSTLMAGRLEGWDVIGIDSDEACCEKAAKALERG